MHGAFKVKLVPSYVIVHSLGVASLSTGCVEAFSSGALPLLNATASARIVAPTAVPAIAGTNVG